MHLLIALDEDEDLTLTASDAADGGDLDDVIDVLTAGGLRKSYHFVGVHWLPRTRIVAHGPVAATVTTADGVEGEIRATSRRVWTDVEFDEHPLKVDLRVLEESELATPPPTSALTLPPAPAPLPSTGQQSTVDRAEAPARRPIPTHASVDAGPEKRPGRTWAGNWGAPSPSSDPTIHRAEPAEAVDDGITRVEGGLPSWGQARPYAARRPPADPAPTAPAPTDPAARDIHSTWTSRPSEPTMREVPEGTSAFPSEDAEPAVPSYDHLFGHTTAADEHRKFLATLEAQTDLDDEDDDAVLPAPSASPDPSAGSPSAPPAAPPAAAAPVEPTVSGGLISSVPWASPNTTIKPPTDAGTEPTAVPTFSGRRTPPPAPSLRPEVPARADEAARSTGHSGPVDGANVSGRADGGARSTGVPQSIAAVPDDAELTVDRSALLQAAGGTGPTVMAVLCPSGHASPPHADRCRICGSAVPQQNAFAMPRPPLGVLRLSTGDIVTLDRNVLLGRAPKPALGLAPDAQPHVVKVPSPERDVSRNHVEVLVDGWHVLIRDLGTTNGTTVALPGEAPVRLRAHDEQALEPGSVVSMADEVSFTFEVGV
jgi:hypothetical protein